RKVNAEVLTSVIFTAGDSHDNPPVDVTMVNPTDPTSVDDPHHVILEQQDETLWKKEVLELLRQLILVQKDIAKGQVQMVQQLAIMESQIRLNSVIRLNQTEIVLTAGSSFTLSCHGKSPVFWSSNAFRQPKLQDVFKVPRSDPRNTGTYHCRYTNKSLEHLNTWIHLYVNDPTDPSSVFVTPYNIRDVKKGQDFLFRCLLTDPSVTNLTLQAETSATWMRHPPSVSVSHDEQVRLEGEKFEVTCLGRNPSHLFRLTWTQPNAEIPNVTGSQEYVKGHLYINKTLTVSAVSATHSGTYTCTGVNDGGAAIATTKLRLLDGPYLRIYLQPMGHANANTKTIADLVTNNSSMPLKEQGELGANISSSSLEVYRELVTNISTNRIDLDGDSSANISGSRIVEVYEGQDVTLTFVIESYPRIRSHHWTTPTNSNINTVYQESYTVNGYRSEASFVLHRVHLEDQGRYSFHFSNAFFSGSQSIDLRMYRSPSTFSSVKNNTVTCSSSGYPQPTILWYICSGVHDTCGDISSYQVLPDDVTSEEEEEEEISQYLTFNLSPGEDVTVECVAINSMGESREVFHPREPPLIFTWALIGALTTTAVLLLLLLVVCYHWRQKPKYEIRWKIIESTNGNNYIFVDPTQMPYNYKWEFPRDKLRLGAVLGSGAFGKVVEATAYGLGTDNDVTRVAVKMLKPSAHSEEREALMSELKILSHLGYHDNIVNLLGACTQGGPMLMITEYCSHGDLLNFLRGHAQDFMASILSVDEVTGEAFYKNMANQHARLRSDSGISCCSEYQEMQPVLSPGQTHLDVETDSLSVGDLMRFSYQVAQGLDFLSIRNCIHRDVAARNVLLTDHRVAKICDFGLARDIRNDDSYIVQGNARLPVKWMAPESIFQCVYTVQSDVWSYGVLLWEIFSLGKSPYPNVAVDTNFYKMIKDGRHMTQPDFAPLEMYQLMTLCWSLEPTDRPTFKMIAQLINRLLPSSKDPSPHYSDKLYRNIDECGEEEEVRGGDALKRGEEERRQRDSMARTLSSLEIILSVVTSLLLACCIGLSVVSWISLKPEGASEPVGLNGRMVITEGVIFSEELNDPSSQKFKSLAFDVQKLVSEAYSHSELKHLFKSCQVLYFSRGSVVVNFDVWFDQPVDVKEAEQQLGVGLQEAGPSELVIDRNSIQMTDEQKITCNFEQGMCLWRQQDNNDGDWIRMSGSTFPPMTGPSFDHTLGNSSVVFQKDGNYGDNWNYGQVTLNLSREYTVAFEAMKKSGLRNDIALDDIKLTSGVCGPAPPEPTNVPLPTTPPPIPADCGGPFDLWEPNSTFSSPNYPVSYGSKAKCLWTLHTTKGQNIQLHFLDFDVEEVFDVVEVRDGAGPSSTILAVLTGSERPTHDLFSTTNQMSVWFFTDSFNEGRGFAANFTSGVNLGLPAPCAAGQFQCQAGNCIPENSQCNGKIDCPDASDEADCACGVRLNVTNTTRELQQPAEGIPGQDAVKVVGGVNAAKGAWPWMVSLRWRGRHACGASLIGRDWVLTAAHCVYGRNNQLLWTAVVGLHSHSGANSDVQSRQVDRIIMNRHYSKLTKEADIAMMHLQQPVNFTGYLPDVLQQAEVPLVDQDQCQLWLPEYNITSSMLCAGYPEGGVDSCQSSNMSSQGSEERCSQEAGKPREQEQQEEEENFYDCEETLEPSEKRGVKEKKEDEESRQDNSVPEDFHIKINKLTDSKDITDSEGRGQEEEAQGDKPQEEAQGDEPQEEAQGDEPQEEAQGDEPQEEAQGDRMQEVKQGDKLQDELQSDRLQEDVQDDRIQEEAQGDSLQDDSDSEFKEEKCEEVEFDDDYLREVEKVLTQEEKESRKQQSLTLKEQGNKQFKAGDWLEAERSYKEALVLCPVCFSKERAVLFSNRAAARLHLDMKDQAITDCTRAIELNPDYVRALLRRAELYEQTDKLDEALEDYKKVLELDPNLTSARQACMRLPQQIHERNEKLKEEMMSKLKDLGNLVLRPFGLSTSNFQVNQDANTGSYSINFVQNPNNNNR
ncbi:Macrophage colony-stimulating factor 1 receptor 2, partial [Nibea albiflora]